MTCATRRQYLKRTFSIHAQCCNEPVTPADVDLDIAIKHARILHQNEIARDVNRDAYFFNLDRKIKIIILSTTTTGTSPARPNRIRSRKNGGLSKPGSCWSPDPIPQNAVFFNPLTHLFQVAGISSGADDDELRHVSLIGGGDGDGEMLDHDALLHPKANPVGSSRTVALPKRLARSVRDFP